MQTLLSGSLIFLFLSTAQAHGMSCGGVMIQFNPKPSQMSPVAPEIRRRLFPSGQGIVLSIKPLPGASTVIMSGAWLITSWMRPARRWLFPAREYPSIITKIAAMETPWCWQMKMMRECKISPIQSACQLSICFSRVCGSKRNFVFTSSSDFMVEFTSDSKKRGRGAKGCEVSYSKPATASPNTTTTTTSPTTTTTTSPTTTTTTSPTTTSGE